MVDVEAVRGGRGASGADELVGRSCASWSRTRARTPSCSPALPRRLAPPRPRRPARTRWPRTSGHSACRSTASRRCPDATTSSAGWPGAGGGRSLILNGHVDVVPAGDASAWPHDPWGGELERRAPVGARRLRHEGRHRQRRSSRCAPCGARACGSPATSSSSPSSTRRPAAPARARRSRAATSPTPRSCSSRRRARSSRSRAGSSGCASSCAGARATRPSAIARCMPAGAARR